MNHDQEVFAPGEEIGTDLVQVDAAVPSISGVARAEIDMQIATAKKYPRSPKRVQNALLEIVTLDDDAAQECMYSLPRGGKPITGPSIRFAEALKQAWGNCRVATRISEVNKGDGKYVEAESIFHDLETNVATRFTHRRRISGRNGKVFSDDMIMVTGNAACSVAMREAILKSIPKPVWRRAYESVLKTVAGDHTTLAVNRDKAITAFAVFGVTPEQIFAALNVAGKEDIGIDHIPALRGMFAAIKNGEETVESIFSKSDKPVDSNYNPLLKAPKTESVDPETGEVTGSSAPNTEAKHEVSPNTDKSIEKISDETTTRVSTDSTTGVASSPEQKAAGPDAGQDGGTPSTEVVPVSLVAYSAALFRAQQGPKSLETMNKQFWAHHQWPEKNQAVANAADKIFAAHTSRIQKKIDTDACKAEVKKILESL